MKLPKLSLCVAAVVVSGCAWLPGMSNEPAAVAATPRAAIESGMSATSSAGPIWLAAQRPGLSVIGKDFLFAGPVVINRDGAQRRYLWFSVATTVDRRITGAAEAEIESVVLLVDDTPMTFDLVPWGGDAEPYELPFAAQRSYSARVTQSQIRQIASAASLDAFVTDAEGRSPTYTLVQGDPADWLGRPAG